MAWLQEGPADRPAGCGVPELYPSFVARVARGEHSSAVGAEGHKTDGGSMREWRANQAAACKVPQPARLVGTPGQKGFRVRTEGHAIDGVRVRHRRADRIAGGRVVEPDRLVEPDQGQGLAI